MIENNGEIISTTVYKSQIGRFFSIALKTC